MSIARRSRTPAGDPVLPAVPPPRLPGVVSPSTHRYVVSSPSCPVAGTLAPMLTADPRPGCPARRSPATGSSSPVARLGLPDAPPSPPKVHRRRTDHPPTLSRSRLVSPVGPPPAPRPPLLAAGFGGTVPRAPVGVALTGMRHTLPALSQQVKRYFWTSQGYPRTFPVTPRSFSFVHRSHTSCSQPRPIRGRANEGCVDSPAVRGLNGSP